MPAPLTIEQGRDAITVISATPGRMRLRLVQFLVVALLMLPFVGCMVFPLFVVAQESLILEPLRLLAGSWLFWTLCAVLVLLFALDGRSRLKIVWGAERMHSSWLFGPLELFEVERRRSALGPLVIVERRVGKGLASALTGTSSGWVVGWHAPRGHDKPPDLIELARVSNQAEAEQLRRRLEAWPDRRDPAVIAPAAVIVSTAELASSGLTWLMRLPLVMFAGFCLALVSMALESLAIERGAAPNIVPWNAAATAEITRMHWRLWRRPVETQAAGGQVRYDSVGSELQAAVRFVDAHGATRVRPLALATPERGRFINTQGGPASLIQHSALAGLRFDPIQFEVPRDVLDIPVDAEGRMRFGEVETEPNADPLTTAWHLHWAGLTELDRPSVYLPLMWSTPTLGPTLEIVYDQDDPDDAPVWLAMQAALLESELATLDGLAYPLGVFGFFAGALACYWLAPRRLRLLSLPLWLLVAVSSAGWTPLASTISGWVGVDRGLQTRIRDTIGRFLLPAAQPLSPIHSGIAAGRWTPQGSRFERLLTQLGVAHAPDARLPDYASAREAIMRTAHARLAGMNADERSALLDALSDTPSLRRGGGDSWLADAVIVPGLCAWRGDAVLSPQARQYYAPILDALDCSAPAPR